MHKKVFSITLLPIQSILSARSVVVQKLPSGSFVLQNTYIEPGTSPNDPFREVDRRKQCLYQPLYGP